MTQLREFDIVVVGAGPTGATAAATLARAGWNVAMLDRESFPRFHIGESLLPACMAVFERMGFDASEHDYQRKEGAEFHDERTGEKEIYPFDEGLPGTPSWTFHVERAQFDHALAEHARKLGVEFFDCCRARSLEVSDQFATVTTEQQTLKARYVIDASGGKTWLGRVHRSIRALTGMGRAAVFSHYEGIDPAVWAELSERGNVKVLRVDDGWVWVIPLHGRRLSIGVVSRTAPLMHHRLPRELDHSPLLRRLVRGTRSTAAHRLGDFSYYNAKPHGARWCCVGDASAFIDPVFSSGVTLGMIAAECTANRLDQALALRAEEEPDLMAQVHEHMAIAYRCFHSIAYRFYNSDLVGNLFLATDPDPGIRAGLITLLAGDVWRSDNRFQDLLLQARRGPDESAPWFVDRLL